MRWYKAIGDAGFAILPALFSRASIWISFYKRSMNQRDVEAAQAFDTL
ncbi:MAG: hypothetical protein WA741_08005 [Candidatus Sulfotelmatobacter sp.]